VSGRRASRRAPASTAGKAPAADAGVTTGAGRALAVAAGWLAQGLRGLATSPDVRRLLLLGALGAGVAAASDAARARVEAWPRFEVDRAALSLTPLPPCLSDRARRDLERLPLPPRASAFDPQLVPFTAACLASLPWVRAVDHVGLDSRGQLAFSLVAREPIARLEHGAGAVTRDGVVVPLDYAAQQDALPTLTGVPAAGDARARALTAAIAVLGELEDLRAHVSAIDLTNLGGKADPLASEIVLTLASGLLVDWGRTTTQDGQDGNCLDGAAKRQALRTVLDGSLDLATVERVSVRWEEVTYVLRAPVTAPVTVAAAAAPARR
jgi:hypothetical protein